MVGGDNVEIHGHYNGTEQIWDNGKVGNMRIRLVKPTIKRYLAGFTKSQFRRVDADEFTVATLLPVQRFKKESESVVWADSRKMV